ncbi:LOB domain-containing protein 1 [Brachypodium distachyon]|uniref:LOB domain-containing protein n=1 Tax=Brachypodium distachyon TaxID=15368 RepID=A0A0Q3G8Q4_BRADI|nr:LOB domain-containing protein 1 [Brachypodium distachyon]KQK07840.1 hypothetical protein BRADI_2g37961v3 [Brachypodium distachyon]|eukprot:XP_014755107.1 LOB domain-containing protein 1 [Brachypodium distachyon]
MESSSCDTTAPPPHHSSASPQPQPATATVVLSPCAACKILRRRCVDRCILAPYFPPTDPHKFAAAHRVFGASNIIKLLQDLPEEHRADAVSSMVYEAAARARDPVYGAAGAICQLQRQLDGLKAQLARAHADLAAARAHHAQLLALLCGAVEIAGAGHGSPPVAAAAVPVAAAPVVDAALLYVGDSAGAGAGGGGIMQASPIGWADEPLWT